MKNLKSKIILLILAVSLIGLLGSCDKEYWKEKQKHKTYETGGMISDSTQIRVIEFDRCEYIYYDNYTLSAPIPLTHKGNCKNPIHNVVANNAPIIK